MSLRSKTLKLSAGLIASLSLVFAINQSTAQDQNTAEAQTTAAFSPTVALDASTYKAVASPFKVSTGDKIEVAELFWFGCGHCFALEPSIKKWNESKPDNVEFVKIPAIFSKRWEFHGKAFYTMQSLDAPQQAYDDFFKSIHVQRKPINNLDALIKFLAKFDKTEEQVTSAFNSFEVDTKVRAAAKISRQSGATGVPSIVVDGKYLTAQGMNKNGTVGLFNTIDLLVEKAAAER